MICKYKSPKLNSSNIAMYQSLTNQLNVSHLFTHSLHVKQFYLTYCATTPRQSGPGSNGNEEIIHIPQSSSITSASTSDYLMT